MAEASSRHLSNGGGSGSGRPSVGSKSTWPTGTGGTSEAVASSAAVSVQLGNIVRRMDQDLGQDEFLRVTLVLCRILQNAIVYGSEQARYRSVKLNAPVSESKKSAWLGILHKTSCFIMSTKIEHESGPYRK